MMNEEQTKTQAGTGQATQNINQGNVSQDGNIVDAAVIAAQRLKEENDRAAAILKQNQELEARRVLGGRTEGGSSQAEMSPEEKKKQEAKEFFKGTTIEKAIAKYG